MAMDFFAHLNSFSDLLVYFLVWEEVEGALPELLLSHEPEKQYTFVLFLVI